MMKFRFEAAIAPTKLLASTALPRGFYSPGGFLMSKSPQVNFRLPSTLSAVLKERADSEGITSTELAVRLLEAGLEPEVSSLEKHIEQFEQENWKAKYNVLNRNHDRLRNEHAKVVRDFEAQVRELQEQVAMLDFFVSLPSPPQHLAGISPSKKSGEKNVVLNEFIEDYLKCIDSAGVFRDRVLMEMEQQTSAGQIYADDIASKFESNREGRTYKKRFKQIPAAAAALRKKIR